MTFTYQNILDNLLKVLRIVGMLPASSPEHIFYNNPRHLGIISCITIIWDYQKLA